MEILSACDHSSILNTILFIKNIINIIFIVVPIVLVLLFSIDLAKNVFSKDDNDNQKNLRLGIKRIIYSIVLLFVPLLVKSFMEMTEGYGKIADCYTLATETKVKELYDQEEAEYKIKRDEIVATNNKVAEQVAKEHEEEVKNAKDAEKSARAGAGKQIGQDDSSLSNKAQKGNGYIAHATSASRGRTDIKGDQNGKEVLIQKNTLTWTYIGRFKDPLKASKAARCGEQGAKNNHIGYGVNDYTSLYYEAKKVKWDLSQVKKNVNTVCSAFASVCINASGVKITKDLNGYSPNVKDKLKETGEFTILNYDKSKVQRGDILIRYKIHVGIAL